MYMNIEGVEKGFHLSCKTVVNRFKLSSGCLPRYQHFGSVNCTLLLHGWTAEILPNEVFEPSNAYAHLVEIS